MSAFTPLGEQSRWQLVYAALRRMDIGQTLTYEALGPIMDLDPRRDRPIMQAAIQRARQEFLEKDLRALESVRGIGYTIVLPTAQLRLARGHSSRAKGQLEQAHRLVINVDKEQIDATYATMFETMGQGLADQIARNKQQDRKNAQFAKAIAEGSVRQERTEEEVAAINARMEALEIKLGVVNDMGEPPSDPFGV